MSATLIEEKQAALREKEQELQTILDAKDLTAEQVEKAEALTSEIEVLQRELSIRSARQAAEQQERAAAGATAAKFLGFASEPEGSLRVGSDGEILQLFQPGAVQKKLLHAETPGYKSAFIEYLRKGEARMTETGYKDLVEGSDPLGGYFVPSFLAPEVLRKDPAPTELRGRVRTVRTTADHWAAPKVSYDTDDKYSGPVRVTWVDETPTEDAHEATDPTYGVHRIDVRTAMLSLDISLNLLEDSPAMFMEQVRTDFSEAAELVIEDMIVNGTGFGQPKGILENPGGTYEPASILSGVANDIDADSVKGINWEVPAQYRRNAVYVFNSKTGKKIALFKDTTNQYLWKRGWVDIGLGSPTPTDTFDGFPVVYSEFMPDVGDGKHPIVFGDLMGYFLVLRVDFSIQVLREVKASQNMVRMLGRMRIGGDVARPYMIKLLKSDNA